MEQEYWSEAKRLIEETEDAAELQARLRELMKPKEPPFVFEDGQTLTLTNVIDRLQRYVCNGSVPALYMLPVHVRSCTRDSVTATIFFNRKG